MLNIADNLALYVIARIQIPSGSPYPHVRRSLPTCTLNTHFVMLMDCSEKGIVGGCDDGTFRPANTVVKNCFRAMLARAFYLDQISEYDTDWYNNKRGMLSPTNMVLSPTGP